MDRGTGGATPPRATGRRPVARPVPGRRCAGRGHAAAGRRTERPDPAERVAGLHALPVRDRGGHAVETQVEGAGLDHHAVPDVPQPARDRGRHERVGRREHVDAQVDRGRLVHRVERGVDQAALAPAPDRGSPGLRRGHDRRGRARLAGRRAREGPGRGGQIHRNRRATPGEQRRGRGLDHRPLHRCQAGSLTQDLLGQRRRDGGHGGQRCPLLVPGRVDVGVVRFQRALLVAADGHGRRASHHERPRRRQRLVEREQNGRFAAAASSMAPFSASSSPARGPGGSP